VSRVCYVRPTNYRAFPGSRITPIVYP